MRIYWIGLVAVALGLVCAGCDSTGAEETDDLTGRSFRYYERVRGNYETVAELPDRASRVSLRGPDAGSRVRSEDGILSFVSPDTFTLHLAMEYQRGEEAPYADTIVHRGIYEQANELLRLRLDTGESVVGVIRLDPVEPARLSLHAVSGLLLDDPDVYKMRFVEVDDEPPLRISPLPNSGMELAGVYQIRRISYGSTRGRLPPPTWSLLPAHMQGFCPHYAEIERLDGGELVLDSNGRFAIRFDVHVIPCDSRSEYDETRSYEGPYRQGGSVVRFNPGQSDEFVGYVQDTELWVFDVRRDDIDGWHIAFALE